MRIIKDENISDIILKNKGYKNLMTGIFSDTLEGAINKKRYIITDTEDLGGYYVCIEGHFLSVCFAKLKNIKGKYVWVQKSKKIKIDKAGILKNIKFINITGFDICGQTKTEGEEKFIAPAGACNTIYEFFGGIPHIHMNGNNAYGLTHPLPIEKPIWAFQELADYKYSLKKRDISCRGGIEVIEPFLTTEDKNGQKYFMINRDCNNMRGPYYIIKKEKDKFPPLPQEAYQAMENLFKKLKDSMRIKKNLAGNEFSMACLQNVNSICYMRCFQPLLFKENITFEEVRRIRIKNDVEFIKGRYQQGFNNYVAWCDDLSGTILQYTKWLIEEGMDYSEGIEPINRRLLDKYGIRAYDTIFVAGITAVVPVIEMLININTPNQKKIRKMIFSDIVEYWPNIQNAVFDFKIKNHTTNIPFLYKYDLKIDTSKKSLHEILCLPKGIFEYAFEKDGIDILHCMQEMFINEKAENINFLTYMNHDDAMWLFALLEVIGKENASTVSSIVKKLIAIKGIVNWKKYVIYAKDIVIMYGNEKHNANLYLTYLDMIDKVDIKLPWKIAKGEMQKMLERARLGSYDNFDKNHEKEMDVLKQKAAEWQKYCYEDGKFLIIFPQKPSDFIKEGDYLHHCAKTYLNPVIKGWTVLVFLRKSSQPDKPFYTVEISGNKIRQVHGMENKDPDKEVEEFLKDYCVEKNILFYKKNAVLGPKNPNPLLPYRN